MHASENGPAEHETGSADKGRAIAVVGAWACLGVAIVAALLTLLF